jgi:hypothetical protein
LFNEVESIVSKTGKNILFIGKTTGFFAGMAKKVSMPLFSIMISVFYILASKLKSKR